MDKILIDTNIFIDVFRGDQKLYEYILELNPSTSLIVVMEVFIGALNKNEIKQFKNFFKDFNIVMFDEEISYTALKLI